MFDIITFGSATKDVFIESEDHSLIEDGEGVLNTKVCFSLGTKISVKKINFSSGGGGTNSAATFAKQGFSVAYCGKIGEDHSAELVLKELNRYGVNHSMVCTTNHTHTSHSVIINVPDEDRTILIYRGASNMHTEKDVDFSKIKAKWLYLAPISSVSLFYSVLEHANKEGIKVAVNPGKKQLNDAKFKESIKDVDVLILNREEAETLSGESDEKEAALKISLLCNGVIIITRGKKGSIVLKDSYFYEAFPPPFDAVDRTGAGDSFGSGFLSSYIRTNSVEEGILLGIANAASCLQKMGAKKGLLGKEDNFEKVDVKKYKAVSN